MKLARVVLLTVCVTCSDATLPLDPAGGTPRSESERASERVQSLDEAEAQIAILISLVDAACGPAASGGQCTALRATLEGAQRSVLAGNATAAIQQLGAFINQVVAFGRAAFLGADATQKLVAEAGQAIAFLGG
jgi:hypothetical protein